MKAVPIVALATIVLLGCKEPNRVDVECKELKILKGFGRYTIVSSQTTVGMYRLDTMTGELHFCRMVGNNPGYQLICTPESK